MYVVETAARGLQQSLCMNKWNYSMPQKERKRERIFMKRQCSKDRNTFHIWDIMWTQWGTHSWTLLVDNPVCSVLNTLDWNQIIRKFLYHTLLSILNMLPISPQSSTVHLNIILLILINTAKTPYVRVSCRCQIYFRIRIFNQITNAIVQIGHKGHFKGAVTAVIL